MGERDREKAIAAKCGNNMILYYWLVDPTKR